MPLRTLRGIYLALRPVVKDLGLSEGHLAMCRAAEVVPMVARDQNGDISPAFSESPW